MMPYMECMGDIRDIAALKCFEIHFEKCLMSFSNPVGVRIPNMVE